MNTICQNLWNSDKVVLERKLLSVNAYIKKVNISNQ